MTFKISKASFKNLGSSFKNSRVSFKILGVSFLILLASFLNLAPTPTHAANANSFTFEEFSADYYLSRASDGTSRLRVVENLTAVFPSFNQNHGIERFIPYTNQDGKNLTMASADKLNISVMRNGVSEPYTVESEDGYFSIRIGSAAEYVHGVQKYTLEYEFRNVITEQENTYGDKKLPAAWQELYWDTNGNDWAQKFEIVNIRVHVEDDLRDALYDDIFACYVGRYGSSTPCTGVKTSDGFAFTHTSLKARENLTFVIAFKSDTFTLPAKIVDYRFIITTIIVLLAAALTIILIVRVWKNCAEKRNHYKLEFVKPEYAPDPEYTVAEIAENYIGATTNSNVATLMELAVTGKIELARVETETPILKKKKESWEIRVKSVENLTETQNIILRVLNGSTATLSKGAVITVKDRSYNAALAALLHSSQKKITETLEKKAIFEKSDSKGYITVGSNNKRLTKQTNALTFASILWIFGGFAIGCIAYGTIVPYKEYPFLIPSIVIGITTVITMFVVSIVSVIKTDAYYKRTMKGLDLARFSEGLKLYIKMAESERIKFLQSVKGADTSNKGIVKLYEKLLPYAIIFGEEKSWLKELGKYYEMDGVAEPTWYTGARVFSAAEFNRAMHSVSTSTSSAISHSSYNNSSSGGSGFSGGHSGGGGGGGGGGGW